MRVLILVTVFITASVVALAQSVLYDQTLIQGSGFNGTVHAVAVQSDGKIVVGGSFTSYNGTTVHNLVRLKSDGSIDNTLSSGTALSGPVYALKILSTGSILVGGSFTAFGYNNLMVFKSDGQVDFSFSMNGNTNGPVYALAYDANGKLYVGGSFTTYNGFSAKGLVKLLPEGSPETAFNAQLGTGFSGGSVKALHVTGTGALIVGGDFTSFNDILTAQRLIKLSASGSLDLTFTSTLGGINGEVRTIAADPSGDLLIGGVFTQIGVLSWSRLGKIKDTGLLQTALFSGLGSGFNGDVNAIAVAPDGKFYVTGNFSTYNGSAARGVARLNNNGAFDNDYLVELGLQGGGMSGLSIALQSDGRLVIGGSFTSFNGAGVGNLARVLRYALTPPASFLQTQGWCQGYTFSFTYTFDGDYGPLNYFQAELSDSSGSFANPVVIGQDFGATGVMSVTLPATVTSGSSYRIRMTSSSPVIIGRELGVGNFSISPVVIMPSITGVSCAGYSDGAISLTYSGANGSTVIFNWYNLGITGPTITGLPGGPHELLWQTSDGRCSQETVYQVPEPTPLLIATFPTGVSCFGQSDGSAQLTVTGGTPVYGFQWSNGSSAQNITGVQAGIYYITVTDANGCMASASAVVASPVDISLSVSTVPVQCFGQSNGSATVVATGGTGGYTYLWSPSGQTTATAVGLTAGSYSVTVTDSDGCSKSAVTVVSQPLALLPAVSASGPTTFCQGSSVTLSTGTWNSYQWSNASNTAFINVIQSGSYSVTVTDVNGCSATSSPVTVTVLPNITENISQTICDGASYLGYTVTGIYTDVFAAANGCDSTRVLDLTVLPNITENISQTICDGASYLGYTATGIYTDVFTAANGCDSTRVLDLTVLPNITENISQTICDGASYLGYTVTGIYTDVFTAANGCDSTRVLDLTVLPNITENISQTICDGASYLGYTVTGIYTDVFTAANGCDSTRVLDLTVLPNITENISQTICDGASYLGYTATGIYTDVFTAANGCDSTRVLDLTVLPAINLNSSVVDALCAGSASGQVNVVASSGQPPYFYDIGSGVQSAGQFIGLLAGSYTVTVTDANSCSVDVSVVVNEPSLISLSTSVTNASCGASNGQVNLTVNGGVGGYLYSWSNGASTEDLSGLAPGSYSVTVTDGNGCEASTGANVGQNAGNLVPQIFIVSDIGNTVCAGSGVPFTAFSVNAGSNPTFEWLVNGTVVQTTGSNAYEVTGLQDGDLVSCRLTTSDPCANPAPTTSAAVQMTVVGPPAAPSGILGNTSVCQGAVTQYSVGNVAGASGYSWTLPSGWVGSSTANTISVTAGAGSGNITVSAFNSCGSGPVVSLQVSAFPDFLSLSGTVQIDGTPAMGGWVYTYTEIVDGVGYQKADSAQIVSGSYSFVQLPIYDVSFILQAVVDPVLHPQAIPSFYAVTTGGSATVFHQWDNPDYQCSITASCGDVLVKNFSMLTQGLLNGICSLNGTVSWATNKMQAEDPIPGVDVVVEKIPPGNAYTSGITDGLGRFRFEDLPVSAGAFYRLYVSIPGIPMADTYVVTVNPSDTAVINLDFYVDTINNVITTLNPAGITQSLEPLGELTLLPNPVGETATVLLPARFGQALAYRITGMDGRLMREVRVQESGRFTLVRENLPAGVYMMEVVNAEGLRAMTRMVVQ